MTTDRDLVAEIRASLRAAGDPVRGAGAQAYLKSSMPSLGVRVPEVRRIVRQAAKTQPYRTLELLRRDVLRLWRGAQVREDRYAAIDLTGLRLAEGDLGMLPVYEEIIRTGASWDLVDGVQHRIRGLLLAHRPVMEPLLLKWSVDPDFWIRRAAITSQLGAGTATNTELLSRVIMANVADNEFFIRKAIGWSLRVYGKTDPEWVRDFAARHTDSLSGLSYREAVRNLPSPG